MWMPLGSLQSREVSDMPKERPRCPREAVGKCAGPWERREPWANQKRSHLLVLEWLSRGGLEQLRQGGD